MRLRMAGVEAEGGFIVLPGGGELAAFVEDIAQVHVAHGIAGMARHGFRVRRAGSGSISGGMQQRAQIVQRQPVRGLARQQIEIRVSGFQRPAHLGEQTGALESQDSLRRDGRRCGR